MSSERSKNLRALGSGSTRYQYDAPDSSLLESFPAPQCPGTLILTIHTDEFTSLCPKTGQPDWARIVIQYVPDQLCVESKSLKLYLMSYRNHGAFHEECVRWIAEDLRRLLGPRWIRVEGRFTARGGIPFWPVVEFGIPPAAQPIPVEGDRGE